MKAKNPLIPLKKYEIIGMLGIGSLAFLVRLAGLPSRWLWYDELRSVTYAYLPVRDLLESVRIFDPHPPLYYLQLHFWMLLGTSDLWIKLNSVLWSMLTLFSIYHLSRKHFNTQTATLSGLIFAISPYAVFYAQEARMYAWLMLLGVWSLAFTYRWFQDQTLMNAVMSLLFSLGFVYSHGTGFIWLASLYSFAVLIWLCDQRAKRKPMIQFLLLQIPVILLYIPWLVRASQVTHIEHTLLPSINDIADTLFTLLLGTYQHAVSWMKWIADLLILAGLSLAALRNRTIRILLISLLLVPILLTLAVSYLYRPIWLPRAFAYLLPFLSLILALTIQELIRVIPVDRIRKTWLRFAFIGGSLFLLALGLIFQQLTYIYPWNIPAAVGYLQRNVEKGAVIYVPNERFYWAVSWYLAGPGSVNPLTTDYSYYLQNDIQFLSSPTIGEPSPSRATWLLYRPIDDIAPFNPGQIDMVTNFNNLLVARNRK